jgi:hypothetical protein
MSVPDVRVAAQYSDDSVIVAYFLHQVFKPLILPLAILSNR